MPNVCPIDIYAVASSKLLFWLCKGNPEGKRILAEEFQCIVHFIAYGGDVILLIRFYFCMINQLLDGTVVGPTRKPLCANGFVFDGLLA